MADGRDPRAEADALAARRFMIINLMRIAGIAMVLAGIAVLNDALPLPHWAGYVLVGLGLIEAFLTPQVLIRSWSTNEPGTRRGGRR